MAQFFINSIYKATEGEGIFVGTPQVFVRFQGCSVGCRNCDSKQTWKCDPNTETNIDMILQTVSCLHGEFSHRQKRVSITGGDPLHPQNRDAVMILAHELKKRDYFVNLEAAGMSVDEEIFRTVDFISLDFKTPSTGVSTPLSVLEEMIEKFQDKFQVKSVIEDEADFKETFKVLNTLKTKYGSLDFHWVLTPSFHPAKPLTMDHFQWVLAQNESEGAPFRVIGQQHKWVFGPTKERV